MADTKLELLRRQLLARQDLARKKLAERPMQGPPMAPDDGLAAAMARADAGAAARLAEGSPFEDALVSGVARGTTGLLDLPQTLMGGATNLGARGLAAAGVINPETAASLRDATGSLRSVGRGAESVAPGVMNYEPPTTGGQFVQTVGEFLPGVALGATPGAMVSAGLASEGAGQLTEGTPAEPYARLVGGILGSAIPNITVAALRAVFPKAGQPNPITTDRAAMLDREGVKVTAGQRLGSDDLIRAEMRAMEDRFSQQADDFTRATMRRIGVDGLATAENLSLAQGAILQTMKGAIGNLSVAPKPAMSRAFRIINAKYKLNTAKADRVPLIATIASRIDDALAQGRPIPSETLWAWRQELGGMTSAKGAAADAVHSAGRIIDGILERGLGAAGRADDMAAFRAANARYRDFLAIERAAVGTAEGRASATITPTQLATAVKSQSKRDLALGRRDLGRLAVAGESLLRVPKNPGTANELMARLGAMTPLAGGAGLGAATGGVVGGPLGAAIGGGLGAAYPAVRNAALRSNLVQDWLVRYASAQPTAARNALAAFAVGAQ